MKNKRFKFSQMAHNRLMRSHRHKKDIANNNKQWSKATDHHIKSNYHSLVARRQEKCGRVLTFDEKRKAFNDVIDTFY